MHKSRVKTRAHLSLLAANIIYGLNYSIAKAVMPDHIDLVMIVSALLIFGGVFVMSQKKNYQSSVTSSLNVKL